MLRFYWPKHMTGAFCRHCRYLALEEIPKKALELYGLASRGGIDNAKERMSALERARTSP